MTPTIEYIVDQMTDAEQHERLDSRIQDALDERFYDTLSTDDLRGLVAELTQHDNECARRGDVRRNVGMDIRLRWQAFLAGELHRYQREIERSVETEVGGDPERWDTANEL